jgi:hypothetical protein
MCFVWIWEQTAIISLYSINWLVFITETECVYCAVRTGSINIIGVTISCCKSQYKCPWNVEGTDKSGRWFSLQPLLHHEQSSGT